MTTTRLLINPNGYEGAKGIDGDDSSYSGGHGSDGTHGNKGGDAKDITLSLSADEKTRQVSIKMNSISSWKLPLGHPDTAIYIEANGGKGGDGGEGGRGGNGTNGARGSDAIAGCEGSDGSPGSDGGDGSPGGNGGHGGNGADGGNGGKINIDVDSQDMDLLMLLKKVEANAGREGRGGYGGRYGSGGRGGAGGDSCAWTVAVYEQADDGLNVRMESHSNSGGCNGRSGPDGRSGYSGGSGKAGKPGQIQYHIKNLGTYPGIYDLSLGSAVNITSDNGIFEPGESLRMSEITVTNSGMMPTPADQIHVLLHNNRWVTFDEKNSKIITSSIDPLKSVTLHEPVVFTLKENYSAPIEGVTFRETGSVSVNARLERVNKDFPKFAEKQFHFDIRYPVEISTISMPRSISRNENAPFMIQVKNISTKPLGLKAKEPRLLELSLVLPTEIENKWAGFQDEKLDISPAPTATTSTSFTFTFPISTLLPGQTKSLVGALKFSDDAPSHIHKKIGVQLHLGKVNKDLGVKKTIAERQCELQLSETYQYDSKADFVLVTNNSIEKETIEQWQNVMLQLGTSMSIWNASLYSGLSYTKNRKEDGRNLLADMKDKVVIILNQTSKDEKTYPTDYLDSMEILTAAKTANISTYVVGKHFDIHKSLLPLNVCDQKEVKITHDYFTKPNERDFQKELDKQKSDLKKQYPERRYVSYSEFNPSITSSSLFKKTWTVGKMHLVETLNRNDAHIAFRQREGAASPDAVDIYHVVKLLPFSKKLLYLDRFSQDIYKNAIKKAILSDLVDELSICREEKWQDKEKAPFNLKHFEEFSQHKCKDMPSFREILIQYEYLVDRVKSRWDCNSHLHRRKELYDVCHQKIAKLSSLDVKNEDYQKLKKTLQQKWDKDHRKALFEHFSNPCGRETEIDSHISLEDERFQNECTRYHSKVSEFHEGGLDCDTEEGFRRNIGQYQKGCRFR